MTAIPPSIADLTEDAKRHLLALLVRDLARPSGDSIQLLDEMGSMYVYSVPENARELAQRDIDECTPEEAAELNRRSATPEDSVDVEEWIRINRVSNPR